jgi:hypothetical protein
MAETRVQIAYHFKTDPAKLSAGTSIDRIPLPEQITRTVSVGAELKTEKVSIDTLSPWDRTALREMLHAQVKEATRTARPAGSPAPTSAGPDADDAADDEISAF